MSQLLHCSTIQTSLPFQRLITVSEIVDTHVCQLPRSHAAHVNSSSPIAVEDDTKTAWSPVEVNTMDLDMSQDLANILRHWISQGKHSGDPCLDGHLLHLPKVSPNIAIHNDNGLHLQPEIDIALLLWIIPSQLDWTEPEEQHDRFSP